VDIHCLSHIAMWIKVYLNNKHRPVGESVFCDTKDTACLLGT
jgi:hypothetical protein